MSKVEKIFEFFSFHSNTKYQAVFDQNVAHLYGNGELHDWSTISPHNIRAEEVAQLLVNSKIFPMPQNHERVYFLSPTANTGIYESAIQSMLQPGQVIISGDLAVQPQAKNTIPLMLNTYHLPFPNNTASIIMDLIGALWHAPKRGSLSELCQEYQRVLKPGGLLIIDRIHPRGKISTTVQLGVIRSRWLPGFEKDRIIGSKEIQFQVYRSTK